MNTFGCSPQHFEGNIFCANDPSIVKEILGYRSDRLGIKSKKGVVLFISIAVVLRWLTRGSVIKPRGIVVHFNIKIILLPNLINCF